MSRKPSTARHRTDTGSAELIELLKASGCEYEPLGGALDGVCWRGDRLMLVDFKRSEKSPLTARQMRLVERGMPLAFVWDEFGVRQIVDYLKREASR